MAARNSSDIYARSDSSGVQGSKIVISPAVLPIKSTSVTPTNPTDYALLFDDVAYNAASNTYSGIGVVSSGDVTIKGRAGSASFGSAISLSTAGAITLTAGTSVLTLPALDTQPITLNGFPALGGNGGVSGFVSIFAFSGLSNCNTLVAQFGAFRVVGKFCTVDFRITLNIGGAGAIGFVIDTDIQNKALTVFGAATDAGGMAMAMEPVALWAEAVPGVRGIRFYSGGAGYLGATSDIIAGSYTFLIQ